MCPLTFFEEDFIRFFYEQKFGGGFPYSFFFAARLAELPHPKGQFRQVKMFLEQEWVNCC
jgi:hypothetical protein